MPAGFPASPSTTSRPWPGLEGADVAAVLVRRSKVRRCGVRRRIPRGLRDLCTEHGRFDGRRGADRVRAHRRWFAFQHEHLEPDVVTMARPWQRHAGRAAGRVPRWLRGPGDHGSTSVASPCQAAVRATLGVMERGCLRRATPPARCVTPRSLDSIGGSTDGACCCCTAHGSGAAAASAACLKAGLLVNAVVPMRCASALAPRGQRADRCGPRHRGGRARGPQRQVRNEPHFLELDEMSAVELDQILAMRRPRARPVLAATGGPLSSRSLQPDPKPRPR